MSLTRSESRQIAARYVSAMFDLALAKKSHETVGSDLTNIKIAIEGSEELRKLMVNPMVATSDKVASVETILNNLKADKQTIEFVSFLISNKRGETLIDVAELYQEKLIEHKGELSAEVTSAKPLSDKQTKDIAAALKKAAGRDIDIHTKCDESIIGGLIIRVGSRMLDRSVAGKLQRLKASLSA